MKIVCGTVLPTGRCGHSAFAHASWGGRCEAFTWLSLFTLGLVRGCGCWRYEAFADAMKDKP